MRNESHIIWDTLENWKNICTGGIYLYDDVSTDNTVEIARSHPIVKDVILGDFWDPDREKSEWFNRQMVLIRAQQEADENTWFVLFDMDEHIYNFTQYELFAQEHVKAIACRLWDFYLTPEDVDLSYKKREWVGPEYRTIIFFFRNNPALRYHLPDQREVTLPEYGEIPVHGSIKHFGKGFSVKQYENTCNYYIKYFPRYSDKWRKRVGKAIHTNYESDFGNKLVKWKDRMQGFSLETQIYGQN